MAMDLKEGLDRLVQPLLVVWNAIGPDVEESFRAMDDELDNESVIEMCLDADHLLLSGNDREANELLHQLCREHGFGEVVKGLCKRVTLA
jgi:hypothetical protein